MNSVDDLFNRYRAAYRAGEDADPRPYLDRLAGTDRRELEALIDAFLARAPRHDFDAEAFARFQQQPLAQRVVDSVTQGLDAQASWSLLLPRARDRARLRRSELVDRLAGELGVGDRRDKVARYYHEMEQGTLPARGVSERVLAALARIVDVSVEQLRAAGRTVGPQASPGAAPVFARSATPSPEFNALPAAA